MQSGNLRPEREVEQVSSVVIHMSAPGEQGDSSSWGAVSSHSPRLRSPAFSIRGGDMGLDGFLVSHRLSFWNVGRMARLPVGLACQLSGDGKERLSYRHCIVAVGPGEQLQGERFAS